MNAATQVNTSAPGPFPSDTDPTYEYPIGIGVWGTYCNRNEDWKVNQ